MKALLKSLRRTARRDCAPCLILSVSLVLLAAGCLSRPALVRQNFALQVPSITNTAAPANGRVLALRSVEVSPLFAGRALVYRTGPNAYELDSYAGFLIAPDRALAIPIRAYLRNSGLFADVVEPGSPVKADEVVDVHVSEFYGDFRKSEPPSAVLSLRMIFFENKNFVTTQVILNKEYSRRVPLKTNTATDLVAAYDQALAEIMTQVSSDFAGIGKGQ